MWRPTKVLRNIEIGLAVVREQFIDSIDGVGGTDTALRLF